MFSNQRTFFTARKTHCHFEPSMCSLLFPLLLPGKVVPKLHIHQTFCGFTESRRKKKELRMEKKVAQGFSYMIRIWQMWSRRRKTVFFGSRNSLRFTNKKTVPNCLLRFRRNDVSPARGTQPKKGRHAFGKSCSFFGRNFMLNNGVECQSPGPVPTNSMGLYVLGFLKTGMWTIKFGHEQWAMRIFFKLKKSDFTK